MTPRRRRPFRLGSAARAVLASMVVLAGLGCGSSDRTGMPAQPAEPATTTTDLRVTTGTAMHGLTLDVVHETSFVATSVVGIGPLADATCAANPTLGRLRASCAASTPFNAPADAWEITFSHPAGTLLSQSVIALTCEASAADGSTFSVDCELR